MQYVIKAHPSSKMEGDKEGGGVIKKSVFMTGTQFDTGCSKMY